jgi:hypothetical protein
MSDLELNTPSQQPEAQPTDQSGRRTWVRPVGLVATGLVAGGIRAGTLTAGAQNTPADTPAAADKADRPAETALEGTNAEKAKAAALEAVEGGTIIRVETDSDGSPFEVHVRRADGTEVVVKMDKDFDTEDGDDLTFVHDQAVAGTGAVQGGAPAPNDGSRLAPRDDLSWPHVATLRERKRRGPSRADRRLRAAA